MTTPEPPTEPVEDNEQPFMSHLLELRDRLLRMVLAVLVLFLVMSPFANSIFSLMAEPLSRNLPEGASLIAVEVIAPFLIPLKATLVLAIFLAMPYVLYQAWGFIAPGLYRHERRIALPLLVSSTFLFYAGAAFAYFVILPILSLFLTSTAPEGVAVTPDIGRYLDFEMMLFFAFGAAFEVPVATFVMVWMGMTTPEALAEKRPYVVVGAFVIGMLLTPPDIISQTLLAVPMWLLYELGIFVSRSFLARRAREAAPEETGEAPLSEAEMEAELDRIEEEEDKQSGH
ncbi:twin-arginine translocase subunit TatC [Thiohalobacter sp. IOR34]|uniref:twin-arginine translocase subunit TatC n=1 Tax=Thiohalobacter sp. IOR34 TaxID=3057176 RepID=UPI0025B204F5|nr:twin-arginine translocase subunit TatC [Thiohalobacter sp. IOR34]WJW75649.1 twin-arginine translocase subunit TatC [Thiohalobacter sp. IOR34]